MDKTIKVDANLLELVKSIKNRAEIFELICESPLAQYVSATLLEDLFVDAQTIVHEYCVVGEEDK